MDKQKSKLENAPFVPSSTFCIRGISRVTLNPYSLGCEAASQYLAGR